MYILLLYTCNNGFIYTRYDITIVYPTILAQTHSNNGFLFMKEYREFSNWSEFNSLNWNGGSKR